VNGCDDGDDDMNAAWIAILGLAAMAAGYRYYSKFIADRVYRLDPEFETPARTMRDGQDYVPTHRFVLWGRHFTAVAGAAPIIGPGIAVIWGWVPAFLWVVIGTVFLAGVHDFGAIWASVRNRARSIGALTGDVVGERARNLFMVVIFLLLLMVNAVFAVAIAEALQATPSSVIPAWSAVAVALVIGVLIYRLHVKILWPTVVGTIILYVVIYVGEVVPVTLPQDLLGLAPGPQWILILFVYAAIASLLPVWLLLQPRDYINGVQLFIGLGCCTERCSWPAPSSSPPLSTSTCRREARRSLRSCS
jgi:carbon starvation protein